MGADGPLDFEPDDANAPRDRPDGPRGYDVGEAPARVRMPSIARNYGWFVGGIGVLLVLVFTISNFGNDGPGSTGITAGGQAPPFAAPLALSQLDGDVNVATKAGSGEAGDVPACSLRRPDVLNVCALYEAGPVVLAFFATRGEDCVTQLDALDDVAARHPDVRFAAVSIKGDRDDLRRTIRDRRWRFPVGYDADGILANAYGVAVCPQITFLRRGGKVQDTSLGTVTAADLEARVRRLERLGR